MTTAPQSQRNIRYLLLAGLVFGIAMGACIYWATGSGYYAFHGGFLAGFAFAAGIGASAPDRPIISRASKGWAANSS
jgi:hypothetical protein